MAESLFTVMNGDAIQVSSHPSKHNEVIAHLFHDDELARQYIATGDSSWIVSPIYDLERWLETLVESNVQNVMNHQVGCDSSVDNTIIKLTNLRATRFGNEFHGRSPDMGS